MQLNIPPLLYVKITVCGQIKNLEDEMRGDFPLEMGKNQGEANEFRKGGEGNGDLSTKIFKKVSSLNIF